MNGLSGVRYFLGFFAAPDGARFFDRVRLSPAGEAWTGEGLRLISGRSEPERYSITGVSRDGGFVLDLAHDGCHERLTLSAETPDVEACFLGSLVRTGDDTALAYVLEEAPAVRLDPSPTHGWGTVAVATVARGSEMLVIRGPIGDTQTPYSFRTANDRHVEPTGYGHFVNHACEPSCEIVYRPDGRPVLRARRALEPGEEITFDYTATEGELAGSFACLCPAERHKV